MSLSNMGELYHHGIKGQHWGIRRGPPYPIENQTLSRGTRINSVSYDASRRSLKSNLNSWQYGYNPNDEWDRKIYTGPFSIYKSGYGRKIYEHQYEVVKDLKMPTSEERLNEFINLHKNDPISVVNDLSKMQSFVKEHDIGSEGAKKVDLQNLKSKKDYESAYELFNHLMENVSAYTSTSKYAEIMSKKYDAMVDDNNVNVYNDAHDPVIIFNKKVLKEIGRVRMVDFNEMIENAKDISSKLQKEGKSLKY